MEFIDLARKRWSCRTFEQQPVEPEKVARIVEAARVAPAAANRQPVRLAVAKTPEGLAKLAKAADLHGAPLAVVVCADAQRAWRRPCDGMRTDIVDATILADHMMLEAADGGLGSCLICWFDPSIVRRELALPEGLEPVIILVAGYAAERPASPERHNRARIPADELVFASL
ncbi:nitroreductase [Gordonibacter sp. An230]|uniref:nitroreductase family protein n=1 Tax=Gordonibacter sp. An230 TaxID=1965592 RepID=UPI000B3917D9|nr:nitroreductase family protein [Gordonibacter sp. An230]OUO90920.1 nitroreductase [Gordonibacter sp. An230]